MKDEIFHIPQAQLYGQHRFDEWDSKITTPPGLYLASLLLLEPLTWIFDVPSVYIPSLLRLINALFGLATIAVFQRIIKQVHPSLSVSSDTWLNAIVASCFPVAFFFYFLYYTDSGSTFFVLLAYWLSLRKFFASSAIVTYFSKLAFFLILKPFLCEFYNRIGCIHFNCL